MKKGKAKSNQNKNREIHRVIKWHLTWHMISSFGVNSTFKLNYLVLYNCQVEIYFNEIFYLFRFFYNTYMKPRNNKDELKKDWEDLLIYDLFSFKIGIEFESRKLELFASKLKITLKTEMKIRQFNFRFWTFQNNKFETKTSILQIVELISNFKLVFTLYLLCHNILFFQN